MNCPTCGSESIILRTDGLNRRRRCSNQACQQRFTTTEVMKDEHQRLQAAVEEVRQVAERLKTAA